MSISPPPLAPFLLVVSLAMMAPATAQVPNALLHSLFDPGTNAQSGALQGYSVAVDGNNAVTGAPYDDTGAINSGVVKVYDATTGALLHTLNNPSPVAYENFGYSVAISGTRVVVGAYADDTGAGDAGSAYVYDLAGATPTMPVVTLTNPSPAAFDYFGRSVAISGTRVVVGANSDDTGANNAGSAYVYDLASAAPTVPMTILTNPSPASGDNFGYSVAIFNARVVVGTPSEAGARDAGSAYVYDLANATPTVPITVLTNPTPATGDSFGVSVAVDGTRVVVGAPYDDIGPPDAGIAYVYDLASATATEPVTTFINPNQGVSGAGGHFGSSVAISGTRVTVGVPYDRTGPKDEGITYVYDIASPTPTVPAVTLKHPSPVLNEEFGFSVAISGSRVVVGAPRDGTGAPYAGSAYLFDLASATPSVPVTTLNHPSPAAEDRFGVSVAVSGTHVVVGADNDNTGAIAAGIAYVYDLANATPTLPAVTLTNPSPAATDWFGRVVAVSGDWVVVGTPNDDTRANNAGSAYVYDLASATPTVPAVTLTNPSPAVSDHFGGSVAVDGTRVVVGASEDDSAATDAGIAYVYDLTGARPTVPVTILTNPTPAAYDSFGRAVSISGTLVVVGASGDDTAGYGNGSVYVYDLTNAMPTVPVATLTNPSAPASDQFGYSVAVSGTRVVVGALYHDAGATDAGIAYVFDLASATSIVPVATLNNPSPAQHDLFGSAVAISGLRVLVGAVYDQDTAGAAYVFDLASGTPTVPVTTLNNPTPAVNDRFGFSVAVDGTTIVAGAYLDDTTVTDRGAAYVFGPRPVLNIVPAAPYFATISWTPATSSGFVLQCTDSLAPTNWVAAPSGAANPVTIPATNASRFYRLFQP